MPALTDRVACAYVAGGLGLGADVRGVELRTSGLDLGRRTQDALDVARALRDGGALSR